MASYSEETSKNFVNCLNSNSVSFSKNEPFIITQKLVDCYIKEYIEHLKTLSDKEVISNIIIPYQYPHKPSDLSTFNRLDFYIINYDGWIISTKDGKIKINIPYEIIYDYAMKAHLTYPHIIEMCFYTNILKNIYKKRYNLIDYDECKGPWGRTDGADGYRLTLFYK